MVEAMVTVYRPVTLSEKGKRTISILQLQKPPESIIENRSVNIIYGSLICTQSPLAPPARPGHELLTRGFTCLSVFDASRHNTSRGIACPYDMCAYSTSPFPPSYTPMTFSFGYFPWPTTPRFNTPNSHWKFIWATWNNLDFAKKKERIKFILPDVVTTGAIARVLHTISQATHSILEYKNKKNKWILYTGQQEVLYDLDYLKNDRSKQAITRNVL